MFFGDILFLYVNAFWYHHYQVAHSSIKMEVAMISTYRGICLIASKLSITIIHASI